MKLSKIFSVIVLLICIAASTSVLAQGRKKEHRNQRGGGGLFHFKKSSGHADAFAKGNRKGFFAKLFKGNKSGSSWVYRKTRPGMKQNREQPKLFTRNRTKAKSYRDGILARQNRQRSGTRVRGNSSFSKSKH